MIQIRKSEERGLAQHGWLTSRHSFSFGEYQDPRFMGFSTLRVINEDRIEGGTGFGEHGHREMEIISYVISGELEHKDSMGNATRIRPGEVQIMSAGKGVRHSEYNHLKDAQTHFFQMWIQPNRKGLEPTYGQADFSQSLKTEGLVLAVSPEGVSGSVKIYQEARLYLGKLSGGKSATLPISAARSGWIQIISGAGSLNENQVNDGDGVAVQGEVSPVLRAQKEMHFLVFELT